MQIKLVLEDGSEYIGNSFGADISVSGEFVFNTGMVGYPEAMTDPSYSGQILILTYPLIGNYGVPSDEKVNGLLKNFESDKIQIKGLVVDEICSEYSHSTAVQSLSQWMKEENIPGICGIDTRALTKKLREKGVMLGKIIVNKDLEFDDPNKRNLVSEVSINSPQIYGDGKMKVVLFDCGVKHSIISSLVKRGVQIIRVPWNYNLAKSDYKYDAIMISNGPGNPKRCKETIEQVRYAMENNCPVFGICLGNQILALAGGADTYKLKYGHRSQNQPCVRCGTNRCIITTQNHGYTVDSKTLPKDWEVWFENANDGTNEGIRHKTKPFMSVQFHPEAKPGPTDADFLFDRFLEVIKNKT